MKKDSDFTIGDLPLVNPVQERIRLLYDNDFLDHEIATLSGLKIKTIKKRHETMKYRNRKQGENITKLRSAVYQVHV